MLRQERPRCPPRPPPDELCRQHCSLPVPAVSSQSLLHPPGISTTVKPSNLPTSGTSSPHSPLQWGSLLTQERVTLLLGHWGLSHTPSPLRDTRLGMHSHSCWETSPGESSIRINTQIPQLRFQPLHVQDQRVHPAHLAELLPVRVWDEGFQGLETSIDALHPPSLVAVGDFPAYPPLLVPLGLRSQWDVGQAVRETRG